MTPDENPYRPMICGEDYRLASLPRDADGNALWRGGSGEDYENYLSWLADYLHAQEAMPLAKKQYGLGQPRIYSGSSQSELKGAQASDRPEPERGLSEKKLSAAGALGMHAAYYQD